MNAAHTHTHTHGNWLIRLFNIRASKQFTGWGEGGRGRGWCRWYTRHAWKKVAKNVGAGRQDARWGAFCMLQDMWLWLWVGNKDEQKTYKDLCRQLKLLGVFFKQSQKYYIPVILYGIFLFIKKLKDKLKVCIFYSKLSHKDAYNSKSSSFFSKNSFLWHFKIQVGCLAKSYTPT